MSASEKKRPKIGISSMVVKEGKVLLGKRKGSHGEGTWATPGGHLEYGETIEECAKRELLEETDLIAKNFIRGPYTNNVIENKHYVTLFIFIPNVEGKIITKEIEKCEGWDYFNWDNLPTPLFPSIVTLVEEFGIERLKAISSSLQSTP